MLSFGRMNKIQGNLHICVRCGCGGDGKFCSYCSFDAVVELCSMCTRAYVIYCWVDMNRNNTRLFITLNKRLIIYSPENTLIYFFVRYDGALCSSVGHKKD